MADLGTYRVSCRKVPPPALEETVGGAVFRQTTYFRPLQLEKALEPMLVTLLGMVMEVRLLQLPKALPSMLVTLLGRLKSMDFRLVQL
jgi:hypothetical protein